MEEIKRIAIYGICATMIFRLTAGTAYARYIKFFGGVLLFSMITGMILRVFPGGETALERGLDDTWNALYESVCLERDYDDIKLHADTILKQMALDAGMYWKNEEEVTEPENVAEDAGVQKVLVEVGHEE